MMMARLLGLLSVVSLTACSAAKPADWLTLVINKVPSTATKVIIAVSADGQRTVDQELSLSSPAPAPIDVGLRLNRTGLFSLGVWAYNSENCAVAQITQSDEYAATAMVSLDLTSFSTPLCAMFPPPAAHQFRILAGRVIMGCNSAQDTCQTGELTPTQQFQIPTFDIDRFEVTEAAYARCVDAGRCPQISTSRNTRLPQQFVYQTAAAAYCAFVGGRLPLEEEWERAARGDTYRIYPWGNEAPSCTRAQYFPCNGLAADVLDNADGLSAWNIRNMAGNMREWTSVTNGQYGLVKGGAYFNDAVDLRVAARSVDVVDLDVDDPSQGTGIRCVSDP